VKTLGRLLLFVVLFAAAAAGAFFLSNHFLRRSAAGPVNYHYWIHSQLGLSAKQESELEPIEDKFARRRDELVTSIREANRELAEALLADKRRF
jgi:nickel and cobalt resistance protein CnrR